MRNLLIVSIIFLITGSFSITDAQVQKYSSVIVYFNGREDMIKLAKLGIPLEEGEMKKDVCFTSVFSERELELIKNSGLKYEILINDMVKYYLEINKDISQKSLPDVVQLNNCYNFNNYQTPVNFKTGSLGGYLTYIELQNELDSMKIKFPNLITDRIQIDTFLTIEGREMFYVKISKNPGITENEPRVLYTALHHAREPVGMQQLIFYMYYLLENYNTDAEVKYLLDNAELYFVPCVNIDGYVYNESQPFPGMWRKNRRDNGDGTFGIDINRNYGYMWAYDTIGSSFHTSAETYRGTAAFSEPETQAVKWLAEQFNFKLILNYHTYSNDLIYPWGYNNTATNDSIIFSTFGTTLCEQYDVVNGSSMETVGYVTNGGSDDWFYGERNTKSKGFAMTPELGVNSDNFWAPLNRIIPICKENLNQNLNLVHLVLKYARVGDASPSIISNINGYFKFDIQRLGLDSPATFTVTITPLGTGITSVGSPKSFSGMSLLQIKSDSISYSLDAGIAGGQQIRYVISVDNGLLVHNDTITKYYGTPVVLFNDPCTSMTTNWTASAGWNTTTASFHSSPSSITDSPGGNYGNKANTSISLKNQISLTTPVFAELTFWTKWITEKGYDYVQVKVSTNNGTSWMPVCGKYTKTGNYGEQITTNGHEAYMQPVYSGNQNVWLQEKVDLSDFIGKSIKLRFTLVSDNYSTFDGFYFDDVKITIVNYIPTLVNEHFTSKNIELSEPLPNPSGSFTVISYSIPRTESDAKLYIYNSVGQKVMESDNISGNGQLQINTYKLKAGVYYYHLKTENMSSKFMKLVKIF